MNCDGVRGLLSAYVDGELSAGELLRVEQHLRRCHACADEVDSLRQTIALVASLDEVEVPASFHAQLHERLVALGPPVAGAKRIKATPPPQRNIRKWAMPAAAAAAVLAIGLTTLQQVKDLPPGSEVTSLFPAELFRKPLEVAGGPGTGNPTGSQSANPNGNDQSSSTDPSNEPGLTGGEGANTDTNQPPGTAPHVPETGGQVVSAGSGTEIGYTSTKQLISYQVKLTATAATAAARQSLLGLGSAQEMHDGSIRITVEAADRGKTLEAIRGIAGLAIIGEPQTVSQDYTAQLTHAKQSLAHWQGRVVDLQRLVDRLEDASDRQNAQVELEGARQQVSFLEESVSHLESEAGKAIFEIRWQAAAQ